MSADAMHEVLSFELRGRYMVCTLRADWSARVNPGQFMLVFLPGDNERMLGRPFCVSDASNGTVTFVAAVVGVGTRILASTVKAGDSLRVLGPLGNGFHVGRKYKSIVLVGGGVGIPELILLARSLKEEGRPPRFIAGAKRAEDLVALDELRSFCSELIITTEDGSMGERAMVTAPLARELEAGADLVAACGPHGMLVAVVEAAERAGVESLVATEQHMACGIGACFGCAIPVEVAGTIRMVRVCKEGPVFRGKAFLGGDAHARSKASHP